MHLSVYLLPENRVYYWQLNEENDSGFQALAAASFVLLSAGKLAAENFTIQVGDTVSDGVPDVGAGRINVHTETDYYTFLGTAGQNIFIEDLGAAVSFAGYLRWELKSPGNATVFSTYLEGNNEGRRTLPRRVLTRCGFG